MSRYLIFSVGIVFLHFLWCEGARIFYNDSWYHLYQLYFSSSGSTTDSTFHCAHGCHSREPRHTPTIMSLPWLILPVTTPYYTREMVIRYYPHGIFYTQKITFSRCKIKVNWSDLNALSAYGFECTFVSINVKCSPSVLNRALIARMQLNRFS